MFVSAIEVEGVNEVIALAERMSAYERMTGQLPAVGTQSRMRSRTAASTCGGQRSADTILC